MRDSRVELSLRGNFHPATYDLAMQDHDFPAIRYIWCDILSRFAIRDSVDYMPNSDRSRDHAFWVVIRRAHAYGDEADVLLQSQVGNRAR